MDITRICTTTRAVWIAEPERCCLDEAADPAGEPAAPRRILPAPENLCDSRFTFVSPKRSGRARVFSGWPSYKRVCRDKIDFVPQMSPLGVSGRRFLQKKSESSGIPRGGKDFLMNPCQRRLNVDPLPRSVAEVELTNLVV